jgi:hypothetical protein
MHCMLIATRDYFLRPVIQMAIVRQLRYSLATVHCVPILTVFCFYFFQNRHKTLPYQFTDSYSYVTIIL